MLNSSEDNAPSVVVKPVQNPEISVGGTRSPLANTLYTPDMADIASASVLKTSTVVKVLIGGSTCIHFLHDK
ncbi:hypothetical protein D3C86_1746000 [compost metagenome]